MRILPEVGDVVHYHHESFPKGISFVKAVIVSILDETAFIQTSPDIFLGVLLADCKPSGLELDLEIAPVIKTRFN